VALQLQFSQVSFAFSILPFRGFGTASGNKNKKDASEVDYDSGLFASEE
jgi:hypothetical protein